MTKREQQSKFQQMLSLLTLKALEWGTPIVWLQIWRTAAEQAILLSRGASKTKDSFHLDGLAADVAFLADLNDDGVLNYSAEKYKALGIYWESIGGTWGGRFGDLPSTEKIEGWDAGHFQGQRS